MHRPVLVTAPETTPVTLAEAKKHLRVSVEEEGALLVGEDDDLIVSLIQAVTSHLDGWTGLLGRCLVEQEWRQDFDCFKTCIPLALIPVISPIVHVKWRNSAGVETTVDSADYSLVTNAGGFSHVRFKHGFSAPGDLAETGAVSVTYKAGYPTVEGVSTVPAAIKAGMLLIIGNLYENRQAVVTGTIASELPLGASALLSPYGRIGI